MKTVYRVCVILENKECISRYKFKTKQQAINMCFYLSKNPFIKVKGVCKTGLNNLIFYKVNN